MTEQIGRVLGGRYRLLAPIGRGASAQVFVADDVRLRRRVAVKVLHDALADDQRFLRRFRTEAQAAAALNHPHVMAVYDWGQDDDEIPWIVTEYLGGGSLRGLLDRGHRLTPSQALVVGLQAARGLDYAHRRGFVHRDVKPANLLFGDEGRLRIADFGLARALAEAAWTEPQGAVVGTARYASPEQAQGLSLTGRADVYSLALVLVEAVTGEVPFATDTTLGTLMARVGRPVLVPEDLGPLAPALAAAGASDPEERLDGRGLTLALTRVSPELPRPAPVPLVGATEIDLREDQDPTEMTGGSATPSADDLEVPDFVTSSVWRPPDDEEVSPTVPAAADAPEVDPAARVGATPPGPGPGPGAPDPEDGGPTVTVGVGGDEDLTCVVAPGPGLGAGDDDDAPNAESDEDDAGSDENDADGEDGKGWDPRSPTGRRRRWPTRVALVVAVLVLGAVVGLLVADLVRATPRHAVPTVSDLSVDDATANLDDLGWDVTVDRVRRDGTTAGAVVGTEPAPGTDLEEGAAVTLVVSDGATLVDLPALVRGMTETEATDLLAVSGLEAEVERRYDEEVPADAVISVASGLPDPIERGSTVGLVVSRGPEPRSVPDVAGQAEDAALAALAQEGLVAEVGRDFSDDVPEGVVIGTDPGAETEVTRDSTVSVMVSQGPNLVAVPDVSTEADLGDAVAALEAVGLVAGDVRGPATGSPAGTSPAVGQEVRPGSEIDIILE